MRRIVAQTLVLAACLVCHSLAFAQAVSEATKVGEAARRQAIRSIRDDYAAALRTRPARTLPIGVFDSGTGGLAVLEEILRLDQFDNATSEPRPDGDGRPDFEAEQFIFLADQANMPYGNYPAAGKRPLLLELALEDVLFLLGSGTGDARKGDRHLGDSEPVPFCGRDRSPVKVIVIACNTATAYGKSDAERLIREAALDVNLISVIEAGAEAAAETLAAKGVGTIGVLATCGTVESGAYPEAIAAAARRRGLGPVRVVQQGSLGLAGAIDGLPEFILPHPPNSRPRTGYLGPSLSHSSTPIRPELLSRYGFDFSQCRMLCDGASAHPAALQINSVENYVAYETVSLLEKFRDQPDAKPLAAIVLGCTHFPYYTHVFRQKLRQLYDYQENGRYVYRDLMVPDVQIIDPAIHLARRLYTVLAADKKLRRPADAETLKTRGQFYITEPNREHPGVRLAPDGGFTQDYKFGRTHSLGISDVLVVPFTIRSMPPATARRLESQLPAVWKLLGDDLNAEWRMQNAKVRYSSP